MKAASNVDKHGVSFDEAATVLADPMVRVLDDGAAVGVSVAIGFSAAARILMVVHIEVEDDTIRIISARRATPAERRAYENG